MSEKEIKHKGGVRTLEDLRLRCRVCDLTDCWRWSMAKYRDGAGRVHLLMDGKRREVRSRKAALYLSRGRDLPAGHFAFALPMCAHEDCCNPAHSTSGTLEQQRAALAKSGRLKGNPERVRINRESRRKGGSRVVSPEVVEEIRRSKLPLVRLAEMFGIARQTVSHIKYHRTHAREMPGASVFSWAANEARRAA